MNGIALNGKYLGGHPHHPKPGKLNVNVVLDDAGVRCVGMRELFRIPWSDVAGLDAEGREQAQSRVTATRLVTLGVFALAAKKKQKSAYLTVALKAGGEVLFQVDGATPQELRGRIAPALALVTGTPPPAATVSIGDPMERLSLASSLHDAGVLTDEEFAEQKARILAGG